MSVESVLKDDCTARQREAFILRHRDDVPEPQAAELMRVRPRRVRRLVSEARRRLACRGFIVRPLPVGRPRSKTVTGGGFDFDRI